MEYIHLTLVDGTSILQSYCFMHHSSTCGMYVTMLPRVLMIHIIHVFHTIHMVHIVHMGANWTYGACRTYGAYGGYGTCGTFGAYGACGTCVTYADETCGTFCCRCYMWEIWYTCPIFGNGSHVNGPSKWI